MSRAPARAPERRVRRAVVIAIVLALFVGSNFIAFFYTDVLWFQEVGFESVLWKSLGMQWGVGLAVGLAVALLIWANLAIAARLAPAYGRPRFEVVGAPDPFERYREAAAPYLRLLRIGTALLIGFGSGVVAASRWQTFLLYANRSSFGDVDPQFQRDIGFYVFELPLYDLLADQAWSTLFAVLFVTAVAHLLFGSVRVQQGLSGISPGAVAHLSVLLGLLALVKSVQYWLGRFQLNFSTRGVVDGASYTDVHAQLPALNILAVISVISALLFLVNIRVRRVSLPMAAVAIWILFSVAAGGLWPWAVQRFSVEPQELPRERRFIQRNIEATRRGFDLDGVETRPFAASLALDQDAIARNRPVLDNVRVWDPGILQRAYEQLQAIRPYYTFPDVDIDRYPVDGQTRQVLLSARELSLEHLEERSQTWANLTLQYTHGYGMVASLANEATAAGAPSFLVEDVPGTTAPGAEELQPEEARLYYGEAFNDAEYSVVNSGQQEIDYPTDDGPERSTYQGRGGVELSSFFRRLAFAVREGDANLILSSLIKPESRIIYYRNVRDRVLRAAPFLMLDGDPYVAAVDGRLTWVLDGYTASSFYPYAQRFDAGAISGTGLPGSMQGSINYLRNSVKVTVDAYDGTMKFFVIDEEDPLIRAWRGAFPDLFTSEEPSADLEAHFRYPEDLFKVQSEVYLTYHIEDPDDFYSKEDVWDLPEGDVVAETTAFGQATTIGSIAPTYLLTQLPGEEEEEFLLARPFTPRNKPNMISYMVGRSDPPNYGDLVTLQFPRQKLVKGPTQVRNLINQDVEISQTLTLLGQEGSEVSFGSLITLPIEESLLYVQPLFVTAENVGIPELKRVVLVFGEEVVMADNFEDGLSELFGTQVPEAEPEPRPRGDGEDREPPPADAGDSQLQEIIGQAADLYERAQQALAAGDFEEYGRLIEELGRLLEQAERLSD